MPFTSCFSSVYSLTHAHILSFKIHFRDLFSFTPLIYCCNRTMVSRSHKRRMDASRQEKADAKIREAVKQPALSAANQPRQKLRITGDCRSEVKLNLNKQLAQEAVDESDVHSLWAKVTEANQRREEAAKMKEHAEVALKAAEFAYKQTTEALEAAERDVELSTKTPKTATDPAKQVHALSRRSEAFRAKTGKGPSIFLEAEKDYDEPDSNMRQFDEQMGEFLQESGKTPSAEALGGEAEDEADSTMSQTQSKFLMESEKTPGEDAKDEGGAVMEEFDKLKAEFLVQAG